MLDAVRYVVDNGVKWANLPADFPPYRRVHAFARRWQVTGLLAELHDRLRNKVRQKEGRTQDPTAAIVDSQSVRAAANIPSPTSGWDGGKKVGGRKRHLVVDCLGLVLAVAVTAANVQDRDAAVPLLERLRRQYFSIRLLWADGGYAGSLIDWAAGNLRLTLQIVKRTDDTTGFVALHRRWVVEICQAQCTHGVWCCAVSAVSVQMRRLYQPGGRVRRSRSSASSRWSAWAMRRWGQQLSRRVVIQPQLIQA
jgi:transposase